MDMPNNNPPTTTIEAVLNKNNIAKIKSYANFAFYLGATNDNISEILAADTNKICGVKVFMGSSTGNMLVDNPIALKNIFSLSPIPVVTHCEEESIIQNNLKKFREKYGDNIPFEAHPLIRSREACIECSKKAIELACKYNTDLHILHISTADEIDMIKKAQEANNKITGEICVHYLWFNSKDYKKYGSYVKCNPAIKEPSDQEALINGLKKVLYR
jgi:Dihydroorotase and related cyclic amidohydrolases